MVVIIDNYDSFTYNLVHYFGELGARVTIARNDEITPARIRRLRPELLVISPGPCTPRQAGISVECVKLFSGVIPLFGVCLGHQAIGYAFGARIIRAKHLMHGKTSLISHDGSAMFTGLDNPFAATRYHSLVIAEQTLSADFIISARSEDGEIMAIRHKTQPLWGVQFHPESILTVVGKQLLANVMAEAKQHA